MWAWPAKSKISSSWCRHPHYSPSPARTQVRLFYFTQKQKGVHCSLTSCHSLCVILTSSISTGGTGKGDITLRKTHQQSHCATSGVGSERRLSTQELTAKMRGLAAEKYGSQLAGHQKNAHVHTHACVHLHTTPLSCSFWKGCVSPVTEQRRPWYSWSSASKKRGKKSERAFRRTTRREIPGRGTRGGADGVMDPSWGGGKVGEKEGADRHDWRKWRTQVGSSCNQTGCNLLRESNYIQTLSACPHWPNWPLTRWSRAWETSGHHKKTTTRKERRRGGKGGGGVRRGGGCEWEEAAEACGTPWGRLLVQLSAFPQSQTSSGAKTASFERSASVAKVRPLKN